MIGKVFLEAFAAQCRIGCTDQERQTEQPILIDIVCEVDFSAALKTDERRDCVDYCVLRDIAAERTTSTVIYRLLESLALDIAARSLALSHVQSVTVAIRKPYKLPGAKAVGIELTLSREEV